MLNPAIRRDFEDCNAFLSRYVTQAKDISDTVYDTYLKLQGQVEGTKNYGRMMDLLDSQLLRET